MFNKPANILIFLLVFVLLPCVSSAATPIPIGAKAVIVKGTAHLIRGVDHKRKPVAVGDTFAEGDRVITAKDGVVAIEFDTGDTIRIDNGSDLVIKKLRRKKSKTSFSIFALASGMVKSWVSKLADSASRFEYHTKAAVCGVSGTPPFLVQATERMTSIDLLGKPGEPGSVYVIGSDKKKTRVILHNGFRTTVCLGCPPRDPFPIDPERYSIFSKIPRNVVPPSGPVTQAPAPPVPETGQPASAPQNGINGTPAGSILATNIVNNISVPRIPRSGNTTSLEELENTFEQGGGFSGASGDRAGGAPSIFYQGTVKVNLK